MHKIVIVDDDKINNTIAKKFLEKEYEVTILESGKNLFSFLKKNSPDLILLDIQMPDMDGFSIIKKIHKNPILKNIPVIFLTADRSEETEEKCFELGASDFISKPFIPAIMLQRIKRTLELVDYRKYLEEKVEEQLQKITKLQSDIIITMANLIESRDGTTGEHVKRTSAYVTFLITKLKARGIYEEALTDEYCDYMRKAAPMHDIGKINIPDNILQKQGSLSPAEREIMKLHTTHGGTLIMKNKGTLGEPAFVKVAFEMASYHHEHWDGNGYPNKIKGEEIPLCARILTVADVFDALVSHRPYKKVMTMEEAFKVMDEEKGKTFEPCLLEAFESDPEALQELMILIN